MDSKAILKRLQADGWEIVRTKGSHHHEPPDKAGESDGPASETRFADWHRQKH